MKEIIMIIIIKHKVRLNINGELPVTTPLSFLPSTGLGL